MNVVVVAGVVITILTGIPVYLQLRQHPRGLSVLFFAEMWERFSYYGMRGLLIFYLTEHLLFADRRAQAQYASYTTLVYLVPLVGGYLADRYLGARKAIAFGALLLVAGHFTMAIEAPPARPTPCAPRAAWTPARSASRSPAAATGWAPRPTAASRSRACRQVRRCRACCPKACTPSTRPATRPSPAFSTWR